jgi:hypothetical protein
MIFEYKYLSFVAAAGYVVRAGTVAAFATLARGLLVLGGLPMRRFFPPVIDLLMTSLTGFSAHIFGGCGRRSRRRKAGRRRTRRLDAARGTLLASLARGNSSD